MNKEIPIYTDFEEIFLFETEKYYYNRDSGEIFLLGERIDHLLDKLSLKDIIYSLSIGRIDRYNDKKIDSKLKFLLRNVSPRDELVEKIQILNLYNGYSTIHNLYLLMRLYGTGLYHSSKYAIELGCRQVYKRYIEYKRWIMNPEYPIKTNLTWETPFKEKLPHWQDMVRRLIKDHIKRQKREYYDSFREIDRRYREIVKKHGRSLFELYIFIYSDLFGIGIDELIIYPKIVMSEIIYSDYKSLTTKNILMPPLYLGVLRQSPHPKVFYKNEENYQE